MDESKKKDRYEDAKKFVRYSDGAKMYSMGMTKFQEVAKDAKACYTVYRFMKMIQINWICFTTILSARIIKDAIIPLDSKDHASVLIIDDSMFERNRSKKVELLAKVYDHAKHKYRFGFRILTFGWSDGSTFLKRRKSARGFIVMARFHTALRCF